MHRYFPAAAGLFFLGCAEPAVEREPESRSPAKSAVALTPENAMEYVALCFDGCGPAPAGVRDAIARDPEILKRFEDILIGQFSAPYSDTSRVLRFLAESGDPRFLDHFLRYARLEEPRPHLGIFGSAVYGLSRHADTSGAARARLNAALDTEGVRHQTIEVLMCVRTRTALELLRSRSFATYLPEFQARFRRILAQDPLMPGVGLWPCEEDTSRPVG